MVEDSTSREMERGSIAALMFISVVSVIVLSTSIFLGAILSMIFSPDLSVHFPYIAVLVGITAYVIGIEIVCHVHHKRLMYPFYLSSTILMGAFMYLFFTTSIAGTILLMGLGIGWNTNDTLIQGIRIFIIAGVLIPIIWGLIEGRLLVVKRIKIPLRDHRGKGIRIALISDVHLGLLVGKRRMGRIIRKIKAADPDIIVSAGDLLDTNPKFLDRMTPQLRELTSIAPSYAVTGNHEFYHGMKDSKEYLKNTGFDLLDNKKAVDRSTGAVMMGVDDPTAFSSYDEYKQKIEEITVSEKGKGLLVFVNHQPIHFHKASDLGIDLMLSGHTHAGQMFPFGLFTRMMFREGDRGLHRYGDSYLYVCIGSGSWGPPIRVGGPSEIAIIDIEKKK